MKLSKMDLERLWSAQRCIELITSGNTGSWRRLHALGFIELRVYTGMFHEHSVKPLPAGREYLSGIFRDRSRRWFVGL